MSDEKQKNLPQGVSALNREQYQQFLEQRSLQAPASRSEVTPKDFLTAAMERRKNPEHQKKISEAVHVIQQLVAKEYRSPQFFLDAYHRCDTETMTKQVKTLTQTLTKSGLVPAEEVDAVIGLLLLDAGDQVWLAEQKILPHHRGQWIDQCDQEKRSR